MPDARPRELVKLADGQTLDLIAAPVRRSIHGHTYIMYGFNAQYPGPLIQVNQKSTIFVNFTNLTERPTTVHWHGVRLDNPFDGVPGVTQAPVAPGETFQYRIFFRDAGIYWYHPHHREDIQQDLGLCGNMLVRPPSLINGEPEYQLSVKRGEVVRFFLTNVEVRFPEAGRQLLTNRVQVLNHIFGNFFAETEELGRVHVAAKEVATDHGTNFSALRENADVAADLVVIKGDPVQVPSDIRKVVTVFKDGVGYDSQKLIESVNGQVGLQ